jgi:hypothetical protein
MNFKEIRLIRLLLWILFYLIALFLAIFLFIIPMVKSYKQTRKANVRERLAFTQLRDDHDMVYEKLKALQQKHRKAISAFETPWNEKAFVQKAERFFLAITLKPLDTNRSDPQYRIYEINARTRMDSPQNFYRFIEAIPNFSHVIEADFPIAFRSVGRDEIEGVFNIRVYEEKPPSADRNASQNRSSESNASK